MIRYVNGSLDLPMINTVNEGMVGLIAVGWVSGFLGNSIWHQPSFLGGYKWSTVYISSMLVFAGITTLIK